MDLEQQSTACHCSCTVFCQPSRSDHRQAAVARRIHVQNPCLCRNAARDHAPKMEPCKGFAWRTGKPQTVRIERRRSSPLLYRRAPISTYQGRVVLNHAAHRVISKLSKVPSWRLAVRAAFPFGKRSRAPWCAVSPAFNRNGGSGATGTKRSGHLRDRGRRLRLPYLISPARRTANDTPHGRAASQIFCGMPCV